MEQWYNKTHKISKRPKNEENKQLSLKFGDSSMGESSKQFTLFSIKPNGMLDQFQNSSEEEKNISFEKTVQSSEQIQIYSPQQFNNRGQLMDSSHISCHNLKDSPHIDIMQQNQQFNLIAKLLYQPSEQRQFCIYNECVVDFDLLDDQNYIYQKSLTQALTTFKKVIQIQKLSNGDLIEVQQESFSYPLIDYTFLIEKLKSLNNQEALKWSQILQIYQQKTSCQITFMQNLKYGINNENRRWQALFEKRKEFAQQLASKYIKQIPRNQYYLYIAYHYDYDTMNQRQSQTGYSRKLLDLMGLSLSDAPTVFLRKGPLDLINKKTHTWNTILAGIQLIGHPKQDIIDIAEGETFIQTLDNIQLQAKILIKTINLTHSFDQYQGLDLPINDDMLVEIKYEIDEENLLQFYQKRQERRILESFSVYDIIDGEFKYLMEVENFLQKYYETNLSCLSSKKKDQQRLKLLEQRQKQMLEEKKSIGGDLTIDSSSLSDSNKQTSDGVNKSRSLIHDQQLNMAISSNRNMLEPLEIKQSNSSLNKNIVITKASVVNHLDENNINLFI